MPNLPKLQLYALPAVEGQLAAEIDRQAPILASHPDLVTPIPPDWLRIPVGEVVLDPTPAEVEALADALAVWVPALSPLETVLHTRLTAHKVALSEDPATPVAPHPHLAHRTVVGAAQILRRAARDINFLPLVDTMSPCAHDMATGDILTPAARPVLARALGRGATVRVRITSLALVWAPSEMMRPPITWQTHRHWELT